MPTRRSRYDPYNAHDWRKRHLPKSWTQGYYSLTEDRLKGMCQDNG